VAASDKRSSTASAIRKCSGGWSLPRTRDDQGRRGLTCYLAQARRGHDELDSILGIDAAWRRAARTLEHNAAASHGAVPGSLPCPDRVEQRRVVAHMSEYDACPRAAASSPPARATRSAPAGSIANTILGPTVRPFDAFVGAWQRERGAPMGSNVHLRPEMSACTHGPRHHPWRSWASWPRHARGASNPGPTAGLTA
jgi:hypothetical protein